MIQATRSVGQRAKQNPGFCSVALAGAALALVLGACASSSDVAPQPLQSQPTGEQAAGEQPTGKQAAGEQEKQPGGGTVDQGKGASSDADACRGLDASAAAPRGQGVRFGVCGFKAVESPQLVDFEGHLKGAVVASGVGPVDDRCLGLRLEDTDPTFTSFRFGSNEPASFWPRSEAFFSFAVADADGAEWRFSFDLPGEATLPLAVGQIVSVDFDADAVGLLAHGVFTVRDEAGDLIVWAAQEFGLPSGREPAELSMQSRAVACSAEGYCGRTLSYGLDATLNIGGAPVSGYVPPDGSITLGGYSISQNDNATTVSSGPTHCANMPLPASVLAYKVSAPAR